MQPEQLWKKVRPAVLASGSALRRGYVLARAKQRAMPWKYQEHTLSILFVAVVFLMLLTRVRSGEETVLQREYDRVAPYLNLSALDLQKPMHRAIFSESLNLFYPNAAARNDSLLQWATRYEAGGRTTLRRAAGRDLGLSWSKMSSLIGMYAGFVLAYLVVMALTYYGVQTMAVYRFIEERRRRIPYLESLVVLIRTSPPGRDAREILAFSRVAASLLGKALAKGLGYMTLYSPAYVIAYSFRSRFDTDTFFFMVLLGVVSNGLLITYAQKFYTFLVAESRKGYVQTAVVKNLKAAFTPDTPDGIPYQAIFRVKKEFPGHIFRHIYLNARYQYLPTLKEQASFLITGLIIIEMALNIHGHLSYELLQNILYKRYDVALVILLGVFLIVKATEIGVDLWVDREARKYENME